MFRKLNKRAEDLSDKTSVWFGHPLFLFSNVIFWTYWIAGRHEDFPYGELTLFVSLEAIVMSILILNAANRKGDADTLLMRKDINISEDLNDKVDELQDNVDEIHSHIEDIIDILDAGDPSDKE
jgi:uncharacterized membrane protein